MKKFIAAFDGLDFSRSALDYAIQVTREAGAHLVGVFLEDFSRRSYGMKELVSYEGPDRDQLVERLDAQDSRKRQESVFQFTSACEAAGISYAVHRNDNVALQELVEESVYADLLVLDARESMTAFDEPPPARFVRDVLNDVGCPVVLVPQVFKPFQKVILLYDGEPSSVSAVKSFSYIFSFLKGGPVQVLTVQSEEEKTNIPNRELIAEFISRHYPQAEFVVLRGEPEDEIRKYLEQDGGDAIVVLGAYRRSRLSRLFRPSMADALLRHLELPLFIAHN
jgi:nucleotide-binding universal stress UspA family protein